MTEILVVAYVFVSIAWAVRIAKDQKPLRNWQWLLSWTVFLPIVIVGLVFAALCALKDWLVDEA